MALNNNGLNALGDGLGGEVTHVSLHTSLPDDTGSAEVSGGSYTREAVTWNATAAGVLEASNQPVFDVPGSTTVSYLGLWDAATTGTFYGSIPLSESETFGAAGTLTMDEISVTVANA